MIDRAGQVRFAGVASEGVEPAVKELLDETLEKAGGTTARLEAERAAKDAEERRARASREKVDLATFPDLPFAKPNPDEYDKVRWPRLPRDPNKQDEIVSLDPRDVSLPEGDWYPRKPSLDGKVIVAYFWHPRLNLSAYFQDIDVLQRKYGRDVVFVGVLTVLENMKIGDQSATLLKDEKDPEKLHAAMLKMAKTRQFDHYLITDTGGKACYQSIFKDENEGVLVNEVFERDPAAIAGIKPGDVITKVDGALVDTPNKLSRLVATLPPGALHLPHQLPRRAHGSAARTPRPPSGRPGVPSLRPPPARQRPAPGRCPRPRSRYRAPGSAPDARSSRARGHCRAR